MERFTYMPIKFNQPMNREKWYKVMIPETGITYVCSIGSDRTKHRTTELHYVKELGRSVPCLHEDCVHCPNHIPTREVTYVPALVWHGPKVGFTPEILAITDSWRDLLAEDLNRWLFEFRRKGGKTSTIVWSRREEKDANVGVFAGFDVEHSLYRAWGLRNFQFGDIGRGVP